MSKKQVNKLLGQAHKIVALYANNAVIGDQSFSIEINDSQLPENDPYVRIVFREAYGLGYLFLEPLSQYCVRYKITWSIGKLHDQDAYYVDIS
jgi:hypothetical protein